MRLILTHLKMSERTLESEQESAVLYRAAEHISIKYLDVSHVVTLRTYAPIATAHL